MLAKNPPVPVASEGVTVYVAPAAVDAEIPAALGVSVTLVTVSPVIVPLAVKLALLVPADKPVP